MTNNEITSLGWTEVSENYFSIKEYHQDHSSYQDGFEYRLSVFPSIIMIEIFPINYGVSGADAEYYNCYNDCSVIFKGKIDNKDDLKILMKWLEIPLIEKLTIKQTV